MVHVMMLIVVGVAMIEEKSRLTLDEGNSEHEFISKVNHKPYNLVLHG